MGNVLLINPIVREWAAPNCVPSGLLYLSSVLKKEGHRVDILDWNGHRYSQPEVERKIKTNAGGYDLVGIGGIVTTYESTKWVASIVKKCHPSVPVIVGGPLATSASEVLLKNMKIDGVCVGEGELTMVDLMKNMENLERVKGIAYMDDGKIKVNPPREIIKDLDAIPFPDYENLDTLEVYLKNPIGYLNKRKWADGKPIGEINSINITSARGCPFSCNFCYSKYLGVVYRRRSVKNVVDEMEYTIEKFDCGYIHFTDELSFTKQRIHEFCDEIDRRGLKVLWGGTFRMDTLDKESMERMRDAGCRHMACGIESFSQKMLKAMNKIADVKKVKENLVLAKKIIDDVDTSFIIGYPGETEETIQESIDACKSLNLAPNIIFFATPYPKTVLYDLALKRGLIKDEAKYVESLDEQGARPLVNFTDFSTERLMREKARWIKETGAVPDAPFLDALKQMGIKIFD